MGPLGACETSNRHLISSDIEVSHFYWLPTTTDAGLVGESVEEAVQALSAKTIRVVRRSLVGHVPGDSELADARAGNPKVVDSPAIALPLGGRVSEEDGLDQGQYREGGKSYTYPRRLMAELALLDGMTALTLLSWQTPLSLSGYRRMRRRCRPPLLEQVLPFGLPIGAVKLGTEPTGFCDSNAAGTVGRAAILITRPGFRHF